MGSKSHTHDSIPNTAGRGRVFLVLFSFCFVFIRLLGFVSCAYKWSCKRPINAHLWKDKEKLSSLFFCLPKMDEEEIDFKVEAEAVIEDIGFTVKSISVSRKLPSSRECVYLNVLTKECKSLCIELSVLGFRVSYVFFSPCLSYSSLCATMSCLKLWIYENELFAIKWVAKQNPAVISPHVRLIIIIFLLKNRFHRCNK